MSYIDVVINVVGRAVFAVLLVLGSHATLTLFGVTVPLAADAIVALLMNISILQKFITEFLIAFNGTKSTAVAKQTLVQRFTPW